MQDSHVAKIAVELSLSAGQVQAVPACSTRGPRCPSSPDTARRPPAPWTRWPSPPSATGSTQLAELDKRREAILKSLEERELLTDELKAKIAAAETMAVLEDIYLPFRPKRRTRATIAKEKGLEPLARSGLRPGRGHRSRCRGRGLRRCRKRASSPSKRPWPARGTSSPNGSTRTSRPAPGCASSSPRKACSDPRSSPGKEAEGSKYRGLLRLGGAGRQGALAPDSGHAARARTRRLPDPARRRRRKRRRSRSWKRCSSRANGPAAEQVTEAVHDGYKRLLSPSMETEIRLETKKRADEEAIRVFAENLRELLLAPPLGQKNVLAIDPGFRTGCKVVCLDRQGQAAAPRRDLPALQPRRPGPRRPRPSASVRAVRDRGHRHRQRHGRPGDRGLRPGPRACRNHPGRHGQRKRRLGLFRLRGGPRGVPRPGRDRARRGLHRPAAHGPAGRTGQDRPEIHRRRPVPARRGSGRRSSRASTTWSSSCVNSVGVEVNTASKQLLTYVSGLGPAAGREHRRLPQRERPVHVPRGPEEGPPPGPQGLRAGGGLPAHPRRRESAGRQRRPPGELRASSSHGHRPRLLRRGPDAGRVAAQEDRPRRNTSPRRSACPR